MCWQRFSIARISLVISALAPLAGCGGGQPDKPAISSPSVANPVAKVEGERPSKAVVDAWEKVGAKFGWMRVEDDVLKTIQSESDHKAGDLPCFYFGGLRSTFSSNWDGDPGVFAKLPAPPGPFGLNLTLQGEKMLDTAVGELAKFQDLQMLVVGGRYTDAGLSHLGKLTELRCLDLGRESSPTFVKNWVAGADDIGGLTKLQFLDLNSTGITDAVMKYFSGLKDLQTLNLRSNPVTTAGLKNLAGLPRLQSLNLKATRVTGGLDALASCPLKSLMLEYADVNDEGLKGIGNLKRLERLDLSGTKITDNGTADLAGLKELRILGLGYVRITDNGLEPLGRLKELTHLDLTNTGISDAGMKSLAGLCKLKALRVQATAITEVGVRMLQKSVPECQIY